MALRYLHLRHEIQGDVLTGACICNVQHNTLFQQAAEGSAGSKP